MSLVVRGGNAQTYVARVVGGRGSQRAPGVIAQNTQYADQVDAQSKPWQPLTQDVGRQPRTRFSTRTCVGNLPFSQPAALMAHIDPQLRRPRVTTHTAHLNAIAAHRAHFGFTHVGTFPGIAWKHERWLDTVFMQRALGAGNQEPPQND